MPKSSFIMAAGRSWLILPVQEPDGISLRISSCPNAGYECGISIVDFRDFKEGDIIEAYTMEEIATTIADANKAAAKKREEQAKAAAAKAKDAEKD